MSHEALIQDLRQKSIARIKKIWLEVEDRAAELRHLKSEERDRRQAEVLVQMHEKAEKVAAPILHVARQSALSIEDEAMRRLAERLHTMAVSLLVQLRQQDYDSIFAGLVGEVPPVDWQRVQVNPEDRELAWSYFPSAEVDGEPSIIGGFVASIDDGRYQVINTLERRLEKGWQTLLPLLLQEIVKGGDATPVV